MNTPSFASDPRWTRRLGVLVMALFQMAGATVLPAADGQLDVERYATPVHMESEGSDDCTPHHDHAFCQVVRSTALANPARSAAEVVALVTPSALPVVRAEERLRAPSRAHAGSSSPRAPPTA
ncbi:MAG: hypothetical protein WD995_09245 [Gemmatimonadota bacterium]